MRKILGVILGLILAILGMKGVLLPLNLSIGGFAGIYQILHYLCGVPYGLSAFVLNTPLFLWARKRHGTKSVLAGFVTMELFSLALDWLPIPPLALPVLPSYISASVAAVFTGIGFGLILRAGSSTGGSDYLAEMLTNAFPSISRGAVSTCINVLIVGATAVLFGVKNLPLSIVATLLVNESVNLSLYIRSDIPLPASLQVIYRVTQIVKKSTLGFRKQLTGTKEVDCSPSFTEDQLVTMKFGHQMVTLRVVSVTEE